jgi:hypothetical protein
MFFRAADAVVQGLQNDLVKEREASDTLRVSAGFAEEVLGHYRDYLGPVLGADLAEMPNHKILAGIDLAFRERRYLEAKLDRAVEILASTMIPFAEHSPSQQALNLLRHGQAVLDRPARASELPYEWERE